MSTISGVWLEGGKKYRWLRRKRSHPTCHRGSDVYGPAPDTIQESGMIYIRLESDELVVQAGVFSLSRCCCSITFIRRAAATMSSCRSSACSSVRPLPRILEGPIQGLTRDEAFEGARLSFPQVLKAAFLTACASPVPRTTLSSYPSCIDRVRPGAREKKFFHLFPRSPSEPLRRADIFAKQSKEERSRVANLLLEL